jgi:hypothetical protein
LEELFRQIEAVHSWQKGRSQSVIEEGGGIEGESTEESSDMSYIEQMGQIRIREP